MPSAVEASCRRNQYYEDVDQLSVDTSLDNLSSDTSDTLEEDFSSQASTPAHQIHPLNDDERQIVVTSTSSNSSNEDEPIPNWYKFKRKTKILLHKLQLHLIMFLKFFLSTLLILATVQLSFPQAPHQVISKRFFPSHSIVKDYYDGNLQEMAVRLRYSDVSFVMYYAPWDRESQNSRIQFNEVAQILPGQVLFSAINCWQPNSLCRNNHKVTRFPLLVLHVNTGVKKGASYLGENRAVPYNGPIDAAHMQRFITAALRPYRHVHSKKVLVELQLTHTAVMLTYIKVSPDSENLSNQLANTQLGFWYRASLHWLEYDKRSEVVWGVVTNPKLALQLGLITELPTEEHLEYKEKIKPLKEEIQPIRMLIADTNFPYNGTIQSWFEPQPLLQWVSKHLSDTTVWLEVSGTKSAVLNTVLHRGPSLIVFASDTPALQTNHYFDIVRGVMLQYKVCPPLGVDPLSSRAAMFAQYLLGAQQRTADELNILKAQCKLRPTVLKQSNVDLHSAAGWSDSSHSLRSDESSCLSSHAGQCAPEGHFSCHPMMPFFAKGGVGDLVWSVVGGACHSLFGYNLASSPPPCTLTSRTLNSSNSQTIFDVNIHSSRFHPHQRPALISGSIRDDRVLASQLWWQEDNCEKLAQLPHRSQSIPDSTEWTSVLGLGCSSNRTVQFGVVDSVQHSDLMEHWGVKGCRSKTDCSGAVLIDLEEESHHVLQGPVNAATLTRFFSNYLNGSLYRDEISRPVASQYRSSYEYDTEEEVRDPPHTVTTFMKNYSEGKKSVGISTDENRGSETGDSAKLFSDSSGAVEENSDRLIRKEEDQRPVKKQCKKLTKYEIDHTDGDDIYIKDLTSSNYENVTQEAGRSVLVLHHSRSCGHCTGVSHTFLTVASMFSDMIASMRPNQQLPVIPLFSRIDVSANTLPWHLNFDRLPFIIYYPPYRKEESVIMDPRVAVTTSSLLHFVTSQLSPMQRLRLSLSSCNKLCMKTLLARVPLSMKIVNQISRVTVRLQLITRKLQDLLPKQEEPNVVVTAEKTWKDAHSRRAVPLTHTEVLLLERTSLNNKLKRLRKRHRYLLDLMETVQNIVKRGNYPGEVSALGGIHDSMRYRLLEGLE